MRFQRAAKSKPYYVQTSETYLRAHRQKEGEEPASPYTIDIRELVTLDEVMDECGLGPNGALLYAFDYLLDGPGLSYLSEVLDPNGSAYADTDDFLIVDCPGQIEFYTSHYEGSFRSLVKDLFEARFQYRCMVVYCMESLFTIERFKYFSGILAALSAMVMLEVPHINVMTKIDLLEASKGHKAAGEGGILDDPEFERYLRTDPLLFMDMRDGNPRLGDLTKSISQIIEEYSLVQFVPHNIRDEDSISNIAYQIDEVLQVADDAEVKEPKVEDEELDEIDELDEPLDD